MRLMNDFIQFCRALYVLLAIYLGLEKNVMTDNLLLE